MKYTIASGAVTGSSMLYRGILNGSEFSPDGQKIAFFEGDKFWGPSKVTLKVVSVNGGAPQSLADICPHNMDSRASVDYTNGDWIYYSKGAYNNYPCGYEVWKVNATTRQTVLVWTSNASAVDLRFSRDATKAIFRTAEWFTYPCPKSYYGTAPVDLFWFLVPAVGSTIKFDTTIALDLPWGHHTKPPHAR
jgi:hypothetical protein